MRSLAPMQMGIDWCCRRVRRYLTLTGGEGLCVSKDVLLSFVYLMVTTLLLSSPLLVTL